MAQITIGTDDGEVTPFWRRIPKFFLFPGKLPALARVVLLSALAAFPFVLMNGAFFLPLLAVASFVAWVVLFRYAYRVLEQTSLGRLSPADYPLDAGAAGHYKPYKQMAVFVIMFVAVGAVAALLGPWLGLVAYALVVFAMPASIMAVAIEDRVFAALNPSKLAHLMSSIGWPYLVLCFFLLMLSSGQGVLSQWLLEHSFGALKQLAAAGEEMSETDVRALIAELQGRVKWTMLLLNFIAMYFTLIMFNLMGYVLYQYHKAIGLDVQVDFDRSEEATRRATATADPVAAQIGKLVSQGDVDAAIEVAYEDQRTNPHSIAAHERFHRVLLLGQRKERMLTHAQKFISLLLRQEQPQRALEVLQEALRLDENFRPAEGREVLPLARAAVAGRQADLALRLLRQFDKRFPGDPDIPNVHVLSAKVLCEHFRKDEQAREILQGVVAKYPNHAATEEAKGFLQVLDKLRHA